MEMTDSSHKSQLTYSTEQPSNTPQVQSLSRSVDSHTIVVVYLDRVHYRYDYAFMLIIYHYACDDVQFYE